MKHETIKQLIRGAILTVLAFIAIRFIFGTSTY